MNFSKNPLSICEPRKNLCMNLSDAQRLLRILPLLILIFVGLGCEFMETIESGKVRQSQIEQTYDVSASRENTLVTAHFYDKSSGKSVDLDAPSKIEHNGAELPQIGFDFPFGVRYTKNLSGLETRHSFVYTNNDGQVFRNELNFEPVDLQFGEIVVSRSQEVKIWLSRRLEKDETLSISLRSRAAPPDAGKSNAEPPSDKTANREDYEISLSDELDQSRAAIILKPKNLKKFARGKAVLKLTATRTLSLQQGSEAGGTMRWSYDSTREANVID